MSTLTFRHFVAGPDAWRPTTRWHPFLAILATLLVLALSQAVSIGVVLLLTGSADVLAPEPKDAATKAVAEAIKAQMATILIIVQATLALMTFALASLYKSDWREVLALGAPTGGARAFVYAALLMVPLVAAVNAAGYWLYPQGFLSDFKQFAGHARSPQAVTMGVAVTVGAPLWEESLFRGFLLGALASRIGYWPAAVLVAAGWTALHLTYSLAGIAEVFVIGLYFAWLMKRTGSLWVPIVCHALYNGILFIVMRYLPVAV